MGTIAGEEAVGNGEDVTGVLRRVDKAVSRGAAAFVDVLSYMAPLEGRCYGREE